MAEWCHYLLLVRISLESSFSQHQQRGVAARRRRIHCQRPLRHEAQQIMRSAGLRSGSRQILATERLYANDGADLVTIDVAIADFRALCNMRNSGIYAAVDAERQAEAGSVDRIDDLIELIGFPADHVQYGAEYFVRELRQRFQFV